MQGLLLCQCPNTYALRDAEQTPFSCVYIIASHQEDKGLNRQITWAKGSPGLPTAISIEKPKKQVKSLLLTISFLEFFQLILEDSVITKRCFGNPEIGVPDTWVFVVAF